EVLSTLARVFLRFVRADEHVFRIGGDEFAVVIDGDTSDAVHAAERIRQATQEQRRGPALPTLSAGVAQSKGAEETSEELFARADAALYAAKDAGRNRIVVAGQHAPVRARRLFPLTAAQQEPVVQPSPMPVPDTRALRILLVDDDPG